MSRKLTLEERRWIARMEKLAAKMPKTMRLNTEMHEVTAICTDSERKYAERERTTGESIKNHEWSCDIAIYHFKNLSCGAGIP